MPQEQEQAMPEMDLFKMLSTFLPFIILWGWGKLNLDTTNPIVLWGIRGFYALSQIFTFLFVAYLESKIRSTSTKPENSRLMKYVVRRPQTTVMAEKATNPDGVSEFEYKEQTVWEYDLDQCAALKAYVPILITLGIHLYFGAIQPLVIQAFSGPLRLFENKEVKIHLLGKEMERPFQPDPSPFASLLGQKSEKDQMDEWDLAQQKSNKKSKAAPQVDNQQQQITDNTTTTKKSKKAD